MGNHFQGVKLDPNQGTSKMVRACFKNCCGPITAVCTLSSQIFVHFDDPLFAFVLLVG